MSVGPRKLSVTANFAARAGALHDELAGKNAQIAKQKEQIAALRAALSEQIKKATNATRQAREAGDKAHGNLGT